MPPPPPLSSLLPSLLLLSLLLLPHPTTAHPPHAYCTRSQPCWPTPQDIQELTNALDPSLPRYLTHDPNGTHTSAVPIFNLASQPLFGLGTHNMKPVYTADHMDRFTKCMHNTEGIARHLSSDFCRASVRNTPYEGWIPAFVVWPLTTAHVQTAVLFAKKHNLAISVANTGHDWVNRHSRNESMLIRTSLLKDKIFNRDDPRHPEGGSFTFGGGIVFDEAQEMASREGRFVASGWAKSVGVVGWSLGGGHGPYGNMVGLGVDNVLEVEIVTSEGVCVCANSTHNTDLFWALKGGGGSTWGIVTKITIKAHVNPRGFTAVVYAWAVDRCEGEEGKEKVMDQVVDNYAQFSLGLDKQWSGMLLLVPAFMRTDDFLNPNCGFRWGAIVIYMYLGEKEDEAVKRNLAVLTAGLPEPLVGYTQTLRSSYEFARVEPTEPIASFSYLGPMWGHFTGGLPSVLVPREKVEGGEWACYVKADMQRCREMEGCVHYQIYNDFGTNNQDPTRPWAHTDDQVSINKGFRTAHFHWLTDEETPTHAQTRYAFGEHSYFAESAYHLPGWQWRYWGEKYERLLEVKRKWDPTNVFGCHHCIGDSDDPEDVWVGGGGGGGGGGGKKEIEIVV